MKSMSCMSLHHWVMELNSMETGALVQLVLADKGAFLSWSHLPECGQHTSKSFIHEPIQMSFKCLNCTHLSNFLW